MLTLPQFNAICVFCVRQYFSTHCGSESQLLFLKSDLLHLLCFPAQKKTSQFSEDEDFAE